MQPGAIFIRWLDVLALLFSGWHQAWRRRQTIMVAHDGDRFVARQGAAGGAGVTTLTAGDESTAALARTARKGSVVLELPGKDVIARHLKVPAKAREFLPGIVRNQIERLSPWPASEAAFGFGASPSPDDATMLDVTVLITARAIIEGLREQLGALGLAADQIVAHEPGVAVAAPVPLWSRNAQAANAQLRQTRWMIGAGLAGCVSLSLAIAIWALLAAASLSADSDELASRASVLQRRIEGHSPQALASMPPPERAWATKETAPSAVILIEAISRALPDNAYLTELRIEKGIVHLTGMTADAPALIAPLERSGHLDNVHFSAPTTRGADGALFTFHVDATIRPRIAIEGD